MFHLAKVWHSEKVENNMILQENKEINIALKQQVTTFITK